MFKPLALSVVVFLVGTPIGVAAPAVPPSGKPPATASEKADASSPDWMTFYYTHPQPDRFVSEVRGMSKSAVLSKPSAEPPIVAFLSRVMAKNPERIPAWMAALADLPDKDKETLHKAIWYSDTDAGKAYLKKHGLAKYLEKPASDILKMEIDSPSVLDMLWGYFFATGDDAPIRRIVSALNYGKYAGALERYKTSKKTADDKKQAYYDVICRAAIWSLAANCRQHPRVKGICEKLSEGKDLNPTETRWLTFVLAKLDPGTETRNGASSGQWLEDSKKSAEKEWMKSDRGFGAMLLFSDNPQQFLDNWEKPTAGVKLPTTESAPRGKPCGAFVVFAGCGADARGLADVVADLTVIKPDGKVYGEQKGVEVWQKKPAPQGKTLQLGVGQLGIVIEPNDPTGTYEIRAKVNDRVKGVMLELKRKFSVSK